MLFLFPFFVTKQKPRSFEEVSQLCSVNFHLGLNKEPRYHRCIHKMGKVRAVPVRGDKHN